MIIEDMEKTDIPQTVIRFTQMTMSRSKAVVMAGKLH